MENKPKTKSADTTVRASFALFQGAILAMSYPLLYMIAPGFMIASPGISLFLLLPILSFFTSSFINWFLQYLYCGSVNVSNIFTAAAVSPAFTLGFSLLAYFLPFLRKPVNDLFGEIPPDALEDVKFARDMWGFSFYLFWAGVYSQTVSSGLVAACP
jgi:hypothetical protein